MRQITSLNGDANQTANLVLNNGNLVQFSIQYVPNQQGWFYSINYGFFAVFNRRLVNSPSMLRAYRNIIPFGLMCTVSDGLEPLYQSDFVTGRVAVYLLDGQDQINSEVLITSTIPMVQGTFIK